MVLELKQTILYGPVQSRRYGRSLGVNLMPGRDKVCSFDCVYCQYGRTRRCVTDVTTLERELPAFNDVVEAIEGALRSDQEFEQITFSGNGEPTLYPRFGELVAAVADLRDAIRPDVRIALLTNSSCLTRPGVKQALARIDLPVLKLDAGSAELFAEINKPAEDIDYDQIITELSETGNIYIQTLFVDGTPSNTTPEALAAWMDKLAQIHPVEAHIYSIERPVPETNLSLVPAVRLEQIALEATKATGVPVKAFYGRKS